MKKPEGHHPAKKPVELEQSILDTKGALATSPDKVEQQQAYPNALAHDTAQESVDNQTMLGEQQPANPLAVVPPAPDDLAAKGTADESPSAQALVASVQASTDLAMAKKEDLKGEPAIIMQPDAEKVQEAKTVDFGKAGKLKIHGLGRYHYGLAGAEYSVTVKLDDGRELALHGIPADLLK